MASIVGNYYVEQGHNVYYFLGKQREKNAYEIKGKIIHTDVSYGIQDIWTLLKAARIMRQYKKKYHIDVAISFMEEFNYLNILSKGKDKTISTIHTLLSWRTEWKGMFIYQKWMINLFYNLSDKVVVLTNCARREMIYKYGLRKDRIAVIPNAVPQIVCNVKDKWKYGRKTVICIGRLEDVKQHNLAIRSFSEVVNRIPDAKLLILGEGSNLKKLKKIVIELKLEDSVFLLGFQKEVWYYLQNSRVFLMTSKIEGFPMTILEAFSVGLPIVTTNNPSVAEILGNEKKAENGISFRQYGLITPHINHDYLWKEPLTKEELILSDAIIKMLEDDELRQRYSKLAKKRAEKYSLDMVMDKWNALIGSREA